MLALVFVAFPLSLFCQDDTIRYTVCNNCSPDEGDDNMQTTYTYGRAINYQSIDIVSDFGARWFNGYDWHKGVDYRPSQFSGTPDGGRGTGILSIEDGRIERIVANGGFKYLVVQGRHL